MKNTFKLIWSDEALKNLQRTIVYLEEQWTEKEISKFAQLLDRQLHRIVNNPLLFPQIDSHNEIRKAVLSKQTSIFYRIKGFEIHIISLFDNRQHPAKLRI